MTDNVQDARDVFFTSRDDDGEIIPGTQPVPGTDAEVRVRAASSGTYEEHLDSVPWDDNAAMADLFRQHFPDLEDLTAEDLEQDLLAYSAETMVELIRKESGEYMHTAMEDERERRETERMMDMMGVDTDEMTIDEFIEAMGSMDQEDIEDAAEDAAQEDAAGRGGGPQPKNENPNPERPDKRRGHGPDQ